MNGVLKFYETLTYIYLILLNYSLFKNIFLNKGNIWIFITVAKASCLEFSLKISMIKKKNTWSLPSTVVAFHLRTIYIIGIIRLHFLSLKVFTTFGLNVEIVKTNLT